MSPAASQVGRFSRRILISVSGLSPQVITETIFALALERTPPFVPTEVHLITTAEGAERARLTLLPLGAGWLRRLCIEWQIPEPQFSDANFRLIVDSDGSELQDLRTAADNEAAADTILETIRHFTEPSDTAVHVSIAGGRKTMGFFAGYALSLLGREQDSMSHVLVSPAFESNRDFFFPSKESRIIYTQDQDPRPLDTAKAIVALAEIPFVRLRPFLSRSQLNSTLTFRQAVGAAKAGLSDPSLILDLPGGTITASQTIVPLSPTPLAFLAWFARRKKSAADPLICPSDGAPDLSLAREYLAEYTQTSAPFAARQRTSRALSHGMDKNFFLEKKSKLHRELTAALGLKAESFFIRNQGSRPETKYELSLDPEFITFQPVPSPKANS